MSEIWISWQPIPDLKPRYYILSMSDNSNGFEVILQTIHNADRKVRIYFEDSVASHRSINESYAGGIGPIDVESQEPIEPWCFFKVENSKYLQWFVDTSIGMVEIWGESFMHFSILGENSYLDIISLSEPVVEFED